MRCTNRTLIFLFLSFLSIPAFLQAQRRTQAVIERPAPKPGITLNWQSNQTSVLSEDIKVEYLSLEGAAYNEYFLPVFTKELSSSSVGGTVRLTNVVSEEIPSDQVSKIKYLDKIPAEFTPELQTRTRRKETVTYLSLIPLRRTSSGKIERLVSFNYSYTPGSNRVSSAASRTYAPFSVLSSGTWYKIGVTADGIYRLSYGFLDSLGIDLKTLNPRNLRIYGNGGAMLPYVNSEYRPDDLKENPIFVSGESDGRFDSTDYVLFYGQSPHKWKYDNTEQRFKHTLNQFSDTSFYFITSDGGIGPVQRVKTRGSVSQPATHYVYTFDDHQVHEQENINLIKSGRTWYGELFDLTLTHSLTFNFPNIVPTEQACVYSSYMVRTTSSSSKFTIDHPSGSNSFGVPVLNQNIYDCYYCDYTLPGTNTFCFTPTSSQFSLNMTFTKGNSGSSAYLDFMEVTARRYLKPAGSQVFFRDTKSKGTGNVAEFTFSDANPNYMIWDVTDPFDIAIQQYSPSGNSLVFRVQTDSLRQFAAFNNTGFPVPVKKGKVENQNLHGLSQYKYVIVAHKKFLDQANRLANLHRTRSGLKTVVVPVHQVFNEFSGGAPDITAIKDFMKMFYDRAGTNQDSLPSYLLLFGDGSYSYKSVSGNTNYVPTYESVNSSNPVLSYVSDDYFGLLDDSEGEDPRDLVDLGIGRFPVQDVIQAKGIIDKIDAYTRPMDPATLSQSCCNTVSNSNNFGDWRTYVAFIADDQDSNQHLRDAESLADTVKNDPDASIYNIDKIYFDSYQQQTVPGGQRYPDAREAFNHRVEKGALIVNYTGHGGELGLSHERVLEIADINGWANSPRLPLFVTATCEFSRFDDPARISAGEYVLLNPTGGGIALLSTTRLVFSGPNWVLNLNFYQHAFEPVNGEMPRIGDICRNTKNGASTGGGVNHRNFTLLGDPAVRLAYPENRARTISVNSKDPLVEMDTIRALTKVTISGYVTDKNGSKLSSYNGIVIPTIFDKPANLKTLGNDADSPQRNFTLQKNTIYKGKASVVNGDFTFSFMVPKDIAYNFGRGRVSYYFMNETGDGASTFQDFIIGGSNPNGLNDNIGPEVKLFMNDKNFISGGMTNENPSLFATVFDSSGINTVGTGIGHDIVAILDKNTEHAVVLNDYYEADLNSFQSGVIRYPYKKLTEGPHSLSLKVWDINNNSAERTIDFVVSPSADLALKHVLNYPNPFTTHTAFYFEHNQACLGMDVQIQIFTVSGKLVKTIDKRVKTEGYRTEPIDWDGRDDFGDKIGRGVYIYRIKVIASNGSTADHYEKLVILN